MKIAVLGAGAWGTALAISAAASHQVTLWSRDAAQAQALASDRVNGRYLPGISLHAGLRLAGGSGQFASAIDGRDLVIIATPMSGLRGMLAALQNVKAPVAWLCNDRE